jgi:hypothetical protein
MSWQHRGGQYIQTEELDGGVIVARFVGDELGLFGRAAAPEFFELVERADRDRDVRAVVFTGSHPGRFISHADLAWLQEDGSVIPPVSRRVTSVVAKVAHQLGRTKLTRWVASKTPLMGAIQLDHMHQTLVRMTTSSTIFVAALNGSALGLGAETTSSGIWKFCSAFRPAVVAPSAFLGSSGHTGRWWRSWKGDPSRPRKHWQSGRSTRSSPLIGSFRGPSSGPRISRRDRPVRSAPSSGR